MDMEVVDQAIAAGTEGTADTADTADMAMGQGLHLTWL
ncbi:hypothetical protein QOZ95_005358 [Paenibacillus brasilensis]|uniref:Uncharacterized protein n=1 Tax=Paenibacillus brasilensis TaxID=128574 RepID=A0ABU0L787_9BACL|nr:hypothetical protein [Paenibacillus brasilensis]